MLGSVSYVTPLPPTEVPLEVLHEGPYSGVYLHCIAVAQRASNPVAAEVKDSLGSHDDVLQY